MGEDSRRDSEECGVMKSGRDVLLLGAELEARGRKSVKSKRPVLGEPERKSISPPVAYGGQFRLTSRMLVLSLGSKEQ